MTRHKKIRKYCTLKIKIRFDKVFNLIFLTVSALWLSYIAIIQWKTATLKLHFLSVIVLWNAISGNDSKWVLDQEATTKKMAMMHIFAVFVTLKTISVFFMLKTLLLKQILCQTASSGFLVNFRINTSQCKETLLVNELLKKP